MSSRRAGASILAVVLALIVIVVLSQPREDPYLLPALDPHSTAPDGLAALVSVLQQSGATVARGGLPTSGDAVAFQSEDTISGSAASGLATWVRRGGTLVVTDVQSPLAATESATVSPDDRSSLRGTCDLTALRGVEHLGVTLPRRLAPAPNDSLCFADQHGAGLVAHALGRGVVVTIADVSPFLNHDLGQADDAALAVALLSPRPGVRVRIMDANEFFADNREGNGGVLNALGDRTTQALWEVLVAFLAWAFFRARRLGKVVAEDLPVVVPSSDLVLAVGEMLARGEDFGAIAERLRRRARRELGIAVGLGAAPDPESLMAALHRHVTLDADGLRRALVEPVPDLASLLEMSHQLDHLMKELHATHAAV